MTALHLVHFLIAVAVLAVSVFDYLSTDDAEAHGAYEANPLMALFQRLMGRDWLVARVGLALLPDGSTFLFPPYDEQFANMILFALFMFYLVTVLANYHLARDPNP